MDRVKVNETVAELAEIWDVSINRAWKKCAEEGIQPTREYDLTFFDRVDRMTPIDAVNTLKKFIVERLPYEAEDDFSVLGPWQHQLSITHKRILAFLVHNKKAHGVERLGLIARKPHHRNDRIGQREVVRAVGKVRECMPEDFGIIATLNRRRYQFIPGEKFNV